MITADTINGIFELFAGLMILNNCRVLFNDKMVRGVSLVSTVFFTCWGAWNLYYYPALGQMFSFFAGVLIFFANFCWIGLMCYYKRNPGE